MITIATTGKAFTGSTRTHQLNAIRSWRSLSVGVEVLLFGRGEGFAEAARLTGARHIPDVATNQYGTPLHRDMFVRTQQIRPQGTYAFVSCDIILLPDFLRAIQLVDLDKFLMVGQRWDIDYDEEIEFADPTWCEQLQAHVRTKGELHPPLGSDYFIYRGPIWNDLPEVAVGRGYEDNELIFHCMSRRVPTIDGSPAILAVHQNHGHAHHSDGKDGVYEGTEAQANRHHFMHAGITLTPVDADWQLRDTGLKRNFARGNASRYVQIRRAVTSSRLERFGCDVLLAGARLARLRKMLTKSQGTVK